MHPGPPSLQPMCSGGAVRTPCWGGGGGGVGVGVDVFICSIFAVCTSCAPGTPSPHLLCMCTTRGVIMSVKGVMQYPWCGERSWKGFPAPPSPPIGNPDCTCMYSNGHYQVYGWGYYMVYSNACKLYCLFVIQAYAKCHTRKEISWCK